MNMLGKAISIAAKAFQDITDTHDKPYILHCLYVMYGMDNDHDRICGVLHDLIEDTDWSIDMLRTNGFEEDDLRVIQLLTHKEEDTYSDYIKRIGTCSRATRIKMRDLKHNTKISRLKSTGRKHLDTQEKYLIAYDYLSKIKFNTYTPYYQGVNLPDNL